MKYKACVLMSGGLDSTVCATLAAKTYGAENVIGIGFDYGQKHKVEQHSATAVSIELGLGDFKQVKLPDIFTGSGSSLLNESEVPTGPYPDTLGPLSTYVPYRNGTFLSIATSVAQQYDVEVIYAGVHSEDAANWAYADCTPEFIGAMANAIFIGTYQKTRLLTPLQWMTKAQVVRLGLEINAPMYLSWSCYNGGISPCKTCPTCISRREAFLLNGVDETWYTLSQGRKGGISHG